MKRRRFVQYSTATALGALCIGPVGAHVSQQCHIDAWLSHPDLLRIIGNESTIHAIGKEYRALCEEEDGVKILTHRLVNSLGADHALSREVLKRQISSDFESGQVVCVKGWVLSVTEARQCALYSFLHT